MEQKINDLLAKIYKIQCKNWIKSKFNGTGAAGETLEYLLGKEPDKEVLPDYNGIELKTRLIYSVSRLHLFSCALDNGPNQAKKLLEIGGYPSKSDKKYKVFNVSIDAVHNKQIGFNNYKLKVDYLNQKILLIVKDIKYPKMFVMSWSFSELKSRLEHKLNYLAIIYAKKSIYNGETYFKYININIYKLISFQAFLKEIENGNIVVTFKIGYSKKNDNYGEYQDRGTSFDIDINSIENLFERLPL